MRLLSAVIATLATAAAGPFEPLVGPGDALPPVPLVAADGRAFTLGNAHGSALLLAFIYTRCTDARMCPLVTAKFAALSHRIGAQRIRLMLVTLDPRDDTPAVLAQYGRAFGGDPRHLTLATGAPAVLAALTMRLGIPVARPSHAALLHTEELVAVGPDGFIARTIDGNEWSADDALAVARATLGEMPSPLTGLRWWLAAAVERCGGNAGLSGRAMLAILIASLVVAAIFGRRLIREVLAEPRG